MQIGVGTVLGTRWELVGYLATGGMADVYRGRDTSSDELVAVKVLRAGVEQGARRFASEVETLQRLDHPHIVRILDAGHHGHVPWLVMELVDGPTLTQLLERGALPPERVRRMGRELADALACAHELGVVNRDIKPGNVLFDRDEAAKLADFGVALLAEGSRITRTGVAIGTASFIAPEQLIPREEVGSAADVYSLGLVLLETLTGRRAFTGTSTEAALERLSRDPAIPEDLPGSWGPLLRRMTARDPASRPAAADVAAWLDEDATDLPDSTLVLPTTTSDSTVAMGVGGAEPTMVGDPAPPAPEAEPRGTGRRPTRRAAVVGIVGVAAVALLSVGLGAEPDTAAPAEDVSRLPAELDEAFDDLEQSVQP